METLVSEEGPLLLLNFDIFFVEPPSGTLLWVTKGFGGPGGTVGGCTGDSWPLLLYSFSY